MHCGLFPAFSILCIGETMGKHINVTNKFWSSSRAFHVEFKKGKERNLLKKYAVGKKQENHDVTMAQKDELIIIWNVCRRHNIPCSNEFKHPPEKWSASQNIRAYNKRIVNEIGFKVWKAEHEMFRKALERKRNGTGNRKADPGDKGVCEEHGGS